MPELIVFGSVGQQEESALADFQILAISASFGPHDWKAGLEDTRIHHLSDRLLRRLLQRVPQIGRLRIAVFMLLEVAGDAFAKLLLAHVLLEHPQHRRAL